MSKIITAVVFVQPTVGTFVKQLLGDPGPGKAYRIESFDATLTDVGPGASDGLVVGLQDGEIEPALIATAGAGLGDFEEMANTDAILLVELQVYFTAAMFATGTGNTGFSTVNKVWKDFVTANEQHILVNAQDTGTKKLYLHLEYTEIKVSQREWLGLRHRPPVVDTILRLA